MGHLPFDITEDTTMTAMTAPISSEQEWQFETPATGGIVVGFDGSPASHAAIQSAAEISALSGWAVHVVSILPPMSSYRLSLDADESPSEIGDLRIQIRDAAIRDAIGSEYNRARWSREVVIGNPASEIARAADERGANLIVLGRSQRSDRLLGGGTTMQVMRCSSVPVRCVRCDAGQMLLNV
jgi:nucleotide-binding universal stress UspA family protein